MNPENQSEGTRDSRLRRKTCPRTVGSWFSLWAAVPPSCWPLWGHRASVPTPDWGSLIHHQSSPTIVGCSRGWYLGTTRFAQEQAEQSRSRHHPMGVQAAPGAQRQRALPARLEQQWQEQRRSETETMADSTHAPTPHTNSRSPSPAASVLVMVLVLPGTLAWKRLPQLLFSVKCCFLDF